MIRGTSTRMKITRRQLRKIIREQCSAAPPMEIIPEPDSHHGEGSMARGQLARSAETADMLLDIIGDDADLPEWVEAKITLAQDYLGTVLDYMRGKQGS